ncbi:hypothetical protein IX49_09730 [Cellulophaga lytica]|nr:hypothetical protein IX49_09730 [Cellulophaga lytica]
MLFIWVLPQGVGLFVAIFFKKNKKGFSLQSLTQIKFKFKKSLQKQTIIVFLLFKLVKKVKINIFSKKIRILNFSEHIFVAQSSKHLLNSYQERRRD